MPFRFDLHPDSTGSAVRCVLDRMRRYPYPMPDASADQHAIGSRYIGIGSHHNGIGSHYIAWRDC